MISSDVLEKLAALDGHLTQKEGRRLAELAKLVRAEHAIVEVGSFKGKSACFLGIGSKLGNAAPVYAVDLWELHSDPKYASPDVFRRWCEQIDGMKLKDFVTPIRSESSEFSPLFSHPIGLLFIDGDHSYDAVARDFSSWSSKVVEGGVVAFHDYRKRRVGQGVTQFVDELLARSPEWTWEGIVDSLLVMRKTPSSDPANGRLVYVENDELKRHLAKRPPQYGLDLSPVVPKRDADGIYVDTQSPHYQPLQEKYRHFKKPPKPLESRVRTLCEECPFGARCKFPRLPKIERKQILESMDRRAMKQWCETNAWGGEIDIVYPYVAGPARGDELRFSLRSVEKNFVGTPRVWIVGDRPDWYTGNSIPHTRIRPCRHRPRFDQVAKAKKILKEKKIGEEFLWMMDDVYFVKPITLGELRKPWMRGDFNLTKLRTFHAKNNWLRAKRLTFEKLAEEGLPIDDMGAHIPYVYEKTKLRRLLRRYRLDKNPYVLNLLYCNVYATSLPQQCDTIRRRDHGKGTAQSIRDRVQSVLILNHPDEGYTPEMVEALSEMFPEPSKYERDE